MKKMTSIFLLLGQLVCFCNLYTENNSFRELLRQWWDTLHSTIVVACAETQIRYYQIDFRMRNANREELFKNLVKAQGDELVKFQQKVGIADVKCCEKAKKITEKVKNFEANRILTGKFPDTVQKMRDLEVEAKEGNEAFREKWEGFLGGHLPVEESPSPKAAEESSKLDDSGDRFAPLWQQASEQMRLSDAQ